MRVCINQCVCHLPSDSFPGRPNQTLPSGCLPGRFRCRHAISICSPLPHLDRPRPPARSHSVGRRRRTSRKALPPGQARPYWLDRTSSIYGSRYVARQKKGPCQHQRRPYVLGSSVSLDEMLPIRLHSRYTLARRLPAGVELPARDRLLVGLYTGKFISIFFLAFLFPFPAFRLRTVGRNDPDATRALYLPIVGLHLASTSCQLEARPTHTTVGLGQARESSGFFSLSSRSHSGMSDASIADET